MAGKIQYGDLRIIGTLTKNTNAVWSVIARQVTIASSDWSSINGIEPFNYTVTKSMTMTGAMVVELVNDSPQNFARYGFSLASATGGTIIVYAVEKPDTNVTLTFLVWG